MIFKALTLFLTFLSVFARRHPFFFQTEFSMARLSVFFVAAILFAVPSQSNAQCFQGSNLCSRTACSNTQFDFGDINIPCAVQAGQVAVACRQNGGRFFGCALSGFGAYLECNGGLARARRARRFQSRSSFRTSCF